MQWYDCLEKMRLTAKLGLYVEGFPLLKVFGLDWVVRFGGEVRFKAGSVYVEGCPFLVVLHLLAQGDRVPHKLPPKI